MKRIRIYTVPKVADRVEEQIALGLGGFTRTDGRGGWVNDKGRVFIEESTVIEVLVDPDKVFPMDIEDVLRLIDVKSFALGEEMTLVTTEPYVETETRFTS